MLPWLAGAAVMGLSGNRGARRAALRGTGSLALASAAVAAKSASSHRLRPGPAVRALPSGHPAAVAAFATAVALESPKLGAALISLATAAAVLRAHTGTCSPVEVLAGAAVEVGVAAATCRWWPLHVDAPADTARPNVSVAALPAGLGLIAVVNSDAGGDIPAEAELRILLPMTDIRLCASGGDLHLVLDQAAKDVLAHGGALGVVGGDGTVNAAAVRATESGLPLAVFPAGTLSHFAADLGLTTLESTADAVEAGYGGVVDLGRVTAAGGAGTCFLSTFGIGVYPELVRAREARERRLGKWPALCIGLLRVLADGTPGQVTVDGRHRRLWLLFAGNSRYAPPGFAPSYRRSLNDGLLDIRTVDGSHPFARTRLVAAFLTGTLARSRVYQATTVTRLRIDGMSEEEDYTRDGEVSPAADTLHLDKAAHALTVYLPPPR
ncbi:diacylglycerol/lipid kinase family protein [Streptomyces sp. ID05-47C]|uniref:diacylglycerol/lipid kinase family protein n=1 Tax=Streptomyces sp. ID05-47C TaxID=3028665 RepID=UPI0029B5647B|nr:diacylglycerol kinase family protein [Streptomyces sp. ID05-47C]MDX3568582.1 diacylglycerol kinase family protein [Streptomyces sp. ID05-47C]